MHPHADIPSLLHAKETAKKAISVTKEIVTKKRCRGSAFSPLETLCLAKAWVEMSKMNVKHIKDAFWKGVFNIFTEQGFDRSLLSIRRRWTSLKRECQNYLEAKAEVLAERGHCVHDRDLAPHVMMRYRSRAAISAGCTRSYAPPFKYVATAEYLGNHSVFLAKLPMNLAARLLVKNKKIVTVTDTSRPAEAASDYEEEDHEGYDSEESEESEECEEIGDEGMYDDMFDSVYGMYCKM